jgi:hypothetical protein
MPQFTDVDKIADVRGLLGIRPSRSKRQQVRLIDSTPRGGHPTEADRGLQLHAQALLRAARQAATKVGTGVSSGERTPAAHS